MARRRGFKAPGNYDPHRGSKGKKRTFGHRDDEQAGGPAVKGKSARAPKGAGGERDASAKPPGQPKPVVYERPSLPAVPAPKPAKLKATITRPGDAVGVSFTDLGLGGNIVRALGELGANEPFPIQAATIPDALAGLHVLGRGRTGSGKTIAFGAALVERLLRLKAEGAFPDEAPREKAKRGERQVRPERGGGRAPKALILAPTRELALQLDRTVQPLARAVGLFTGQFVGGQPFEPQLHALKRGVDIAIGTPGRIEDLAKRGHLNLGRVTVTVVDEADHMAELGFIEPVQRILRQTRRGGQRMLFSATLDAAVEALVAEFMPRPAVHEVIDTVESEGAPGPASVHGLNPNVEHRVLIVMHEHKDAALFELVRSGGTAAREGVLSHGVVRTIVFCRTRAYAEMVAEMLAEAGVRTVALHGDLSQSRRERNLAKFMEGKADVLVATDIAARGIHVDDVELVLQADPPEDSKAYVHRAGRTGRIDRGGLVLTVIPRTRQKRTRELFAELGFEPASFGDYLPAAPR